VEGNVKEGKTIVGRREVTAAGTNMVTSTRSTREARRRRRKGSTRSTASMTPTAREDEWLREAPKRAVCVVDKRRIRFLIVFTPQRVCRFLFSPHAPAPFRFAMYIARQRLNNGHGPPSNAFQGRDSELKALALVWLALHLRTKRWYWGTCVLEALIRVVSIFELAGTQYMKRKAL